MKRVSKNIGAGVSISARAILMCALWLASTALLQAAESEQLIVFVSSSGSMIDESFRVSLLPEVIRAADELGVPVHIRDTTQGVPREISITPLLVYQNHRGRSIYQGRTTTPDRIRNFIRTSRYVPQGDTPYIREHTMGWRSGRALVWAPLKVAAVTGTAPPEYDHEKFTAQAVRAIDKGAKRFRMRKSVEIQRGDRGFYMDFNPWLSQDGTLFLSVSVYSQFHCKTPVFTNSGTPLVGPWSRRNSLFREAGALAGAAVFNAMNDPAGGDGFEPVNKRVEETDWTQVGFPLPAPPVGEQRAAVKGGAIPHRWTMAPEPHADEPPRILLRFPAPLDQYAGEVKIVSGEFFLAEDGSCDDAAGSFTADPSSVTMGVPDLDRALKGSLFLDIAKHPSSKFVIVSAESDGHPLAYARLSPLSLTGMLTLKGHDELLSATMEAEPIVGDDGNPRLLLRGTFGIDLRNFKIEGAEGPAPARHNLKFDLNFTMTPTP